MTKAQLRKLMSKANKHAARWQQRTENESHARRYSAGVEFVMGETLPEYQRREQRNIGKLVQAKRVELVS